MRDIEVLKLGVAGLGRGFAAMSPALALDPRLKLVACADTREAARAKFSADFAARSYATVEALCADPEVEAVYVATPHQFHRQHVEIAARCGKHVLVEKPLALTLDECRAMTDAVRRHRIELVVGHSHGFDAPVRRARELIDSGRFGRVRMISALNFTDFIYRPRRPEELDTAQGGGVVYSQGAHQIDIVRLLGGGKVETVRACTGAWDPARATESAYSVLLTFENGTFATLVYSGFAHFDAAELTGWIAENGQRKDPMRYGEMRRLIDSVPDAGAEAALKAERGYGNAGYAGPDLNLFRRRAREANLSHGHFGLVVVSCEHADLWPLPTGVGVYAHRKKYVEPLPPPAWPRREVIDELYEAVKGGRRTVHSVEWGTATLEVCLALLESARTGREIRLVHQVTV